MYEGSTGNTRSSQLHCHIPETIQSYAEAFSSHTELWVGSWGQKLMIFHPHRKKKKSFFRINSDSSITCQAVCTDPHNLVGGVGHIQSQYSLPEVEGLSSPHHKSLSTLGCLGLHGSHLRKAYIVSGHCLTQNVIHCRNSKYQISMWDFHVLRQRVSTQ